MSTTATACPPSVVPVGPTATTARSGRARRSPSTTGEGPASHDGSAGTSRQRTSTGPTIAVVAVASVLTPLDPCGYVSCTPIRGAALGAPLPTNPASKDRR